MNAIVKLTSGSFSANLVKQTVPVEPSTTIHRSLFSSEWTTDRKPRQTSEMFIHMKAYGSKLGMPDQMQYLPNVWIPLTEKRQRWLFDLQCFAAYGKLASQLTKLEKATALTQWASFMHGGRCFTNGFGWNDGRADYIQGMNLSAKPMLWEPLLLANNLVEVIGEKISLTNNYLGLGTKQYLHYPIKVLNATDDTKLPPVNEFFYEKTLCHVPTTIKPDGTRGRFPQFNEKCVYPLWSIKQENLVWDILISK